MSRSIVAIRAAVAVAPLVLWPSLGRAQEAPATAASPQPPAGYTPMPATKDVDVPVEQPNAGPNLPLLTTGAVLFGGTYAASAVVASQAGRPDDNNLYYPIVGPWMDYAQRNCGAFPCSNENLDKALLILDGIGQGAGAVLLVTSLLVPNGHHYLTVGSADRGEPQVTFTPSQVGATGYGLGVVGLF